MEESLLTSSEIFALLAYALVVGWLTLSKNAPLKDWCNENSVLGIVIFVFLGPIIIAAIMS